MPLSQMGTISSTICAMFLRGSEAGGDGGSWENVLWNRLAVTRETLILLQLWSLPEPASMWPQGNKSCSGPLPRS